MRLAYDELTTWTLRWIGFRWRGALLVHVRDEYPEGIVDRWWLGPFLAKRMTRKWEGRDG